MSNYRLAIADSFDMDSIALNALALLRESFDRAPKSAVRASGLPHSDRYMRMLLTGEKPIAMHIFVRLLNVVRERGDRKGVGCGRERVRRILAALAAPFGLDVVNRADRPTKDPKTEALEAAAAVGDVFQKLHANAPEADIEGAVVRATDELQDVAKAVRS